MNVLFTGDDDPLRFIFKMLDVVVDVEGVLVQPGKVMQLEKTTHANVPQCVLHCVLQCV